MVVVLLWAVLPRGAARPRLGRQHPLQPLHRTPGAAILTRTEAARGLAARAARREPEADAGRREVRENCAVSPRPAGLTMAQETRLAISAPPGSQALLDALLQNLYDFGETEDETEEKRVRKKREKKRGMGTLASLATEPAPQPESLVRGQRKSAASFFQELQEELQGAPAVTPSGSPVGPVVSGAAAARSPPRNDREPVEVVQFHSRSKKRKQNPDQEENAKTKTKDQNHLDKDVGIQEFNLEKARLEVHRFGITGYGKGKERVLEQERAIMLGARPPKKSYVNYKVLQEHIKEKKAAKEEEKRMAKDTDIFKKKKRKGQEDRKSKKKKSAPSILSSGRIGQVGKFKNGTLILSQIDIKKINSSRVAK